MRLCSVCVPRFACLPCREIFCDCFSSSSSVIATHLACRLALNRFVYSTLWKWRYPLSRHEKPTIIIFRFSGIHGMSWEENQGTVMKVRKYNGEYYEEDNSSKLESIFWTGKKRSELVWNSKYWKTIMENSKTNGVHGRKEGMQTVLEMKLIEKNGMKKWKIWYD